MKFSERQIFSILTTVLTLVFTIYLHLYSNDGGTGWYIYTGPIATFISCLSLWKSRPIHRSILSIVTFSATLTILTHILNILIMVSYMLVLGFATGHPDYGLVVGLITFGIFMSLMKGGLITFSIFLVSSFFFFSSILQRIKSYLSHTKILIFIPTVKQFLPAVTLTGYLLVLRFTNISLVGFWTDILFAILLATLVILTISKSKNFGRPTRVILRLVSVFTLLFLSSFGLRYLNPFTWDTFKTRAFLYTKIDGRLFHGYFIPTGAYGSGYGQFWVTESPLFLPILEADRYYNPVIPYDLSKNDLEGTPIRQVVDAIILENVLGQKIR